MDKKDIAKKKSNIFEMTVNKIKPIIVKKKDLGNFFLISQGFLNER